MSDRGRRGKPTGRWSPFGQGATGDISLTATQDANEFVAWRQPRFSGYTPSPLVYRGRVYAINDNGILQVANVKSGAEIFKARVGGGGHTFSSSPLASQGRIYLVSEDGDTFVLRAGDQYEELAKNTLGGDEPCDPRGGRQQPVYPDADPALPDPRAGRELMESACSPTAAVP